MAREAHVQNPRRLYKFQSAETAEKVLTSRSLRISRFLDLNDPFELCALSLHDRALRQKHRDWLEEENDKTGLSCFSTSFANPVQWSHYAENHRGICISYDVEESICFDVKYVPRRLYKKIDAGNFLNIVRPENVEDLVLTKFHHWRYEKETRVLFDLTNMKMDAHGHYYYEFDDRVQPREVFLGPRYESGSKPCMRSLARESSLDVVTTRMSFKTFRICKQKDRKLWKTL